LALVAHHKRAESLADCLTKRGLKLRAGWFFWRQKSRCYRWKNAEEEL